MKRPTQEEIAAAKVDALARFGRDELLYVELPAPIGAVVLVAPFDRESYGEHSDDQRRDLQTSYRNAVHARRAWPSAAEVADLLDRRPAAASKICGKLQARAGNVPGEPRVEVLDDVIARTAPGAQVLPGLTLDAARKLLADHDGQELFAVLGPGSLSLVMVRPEGDVWLAARAARARAAATSKRVYETGLDSALQAVTWSATPIEALLDDKPAAGPDIVAAFDAMGGDAAEATSKSV